MPYPMSPFNLNFDWNKLILGQKELPDDLSLDYIHNLLKWLCTTPKVTSYRVNTLQYRVDQVSELIRAEVVNFAEKCKCDVPKIAIHPVLPEVILLHNIDDKFLCFEKKDKEVIIDPQCAAAVLRGAHIYAPGIMGMNSGTCIDDTVSIYADISENCKKGLQTKYDCPERIFIGNGIVKMTRYQLFGKNLVLRGIAVEVTNTVSGCPNMPNFLPSSAAILQNIPSMVCVYALDPQEGETVLDMCAAPGNKTTHIAALMKNQGTLVAIDKTPNKIKRLQENCDQFGVKVRIIRADSTRLISNKLFAEETFDKILLDAPCSALGQRPQLVNNITDTVLRSYVPLQRQLLTNAVQLLKVEGRLVYSTCTITLAENEQLVAWALKTFECLELIKAVPSVGGIGLPCKNLTEQQRNCVQRFGPEQDYIGFFIAVFVKNKTTDV